MNEVFLGKSIGEHSDDAWYVDSQIPAADALSEIPETVELLEELEAPAAADDELDEESELPAVAVAAEEEEVFFDANSASRGRSKTIARKQMLRERRRMLSQGLIPDVLEYDRPVHRVECRSAKRPCLYVSCRYHLYLDVNPMTGSIKINFPDLEVWQLTESCALDVAERGGVTLEEVGAIMNLTRERIRQVEVSGLSKMKDTDATLETFLDGRELTLRPPSGPSPRLPVVDD